ncbi:hypothetical protein [Corynebacterium nasicanis]|uniref:Trehalose synthase n=1 Tax=Corynebacterium nasicanis TaxID=1448267 RepID=A0ABW1QBL3_9CORY
MDLAHMLADARFYGAKSEPIDRVDIVSETPAGEARLLILRVNGRHLYQVLVDAEGRDILSESPELYLQAHGLPQGETRAIDGEQSNTSLIVDGQMVKVFRHLEPGLNPDVELLSQIADCPHVAPVRHWVTATIDDAEHTLAMVQDFVPDADDGWRYALGFASLDASFGAEASLLGEATRAVHEALAGAFPVSADAPSFRRSLDELVGRAQVLEEFSGAARAFYADLDDEVDVQRVHGDLHLGQVLRTADTYILIDFEGEPARPLAERRRPDSPLRDVAGILRSLDYAAHVAGADPAWADAAGAAFLEGYGIERTPLLDAYVLDKALYEVVYESDNRPDWVDIPLRAVRRLLESPQ